MNLELWKKMFHSPDVAICERTGKNAEIINRWYWQPEGGTISDEKLVYELQSFNNFAAEKTGEKVFDAGEKPANTGAKKVAKYLLNLGLSR